MSSKISLITGISGQDGSYLAEYLDGLGHRIFGVARDPSVVRRQLPATISDVVNLIEWDLGDQISIEEAIRHVRPDFVFNFAAFSTGTGMYDDPVGMGEINGLTVTRILESISKVDTKIRFCQASSREIYGEALTSPQNEATAVNPRSPYGAAKLYADNMIRIYRKQYGLFACSAILFNHESPRRGLQFVTRKITHEAAKIKLGLSQELKLGNLDAQRDWGFAGDYVRAMWLMLQQDQPDDYVVATGKAHSVREFCNLAFSRLGLNYKDHVAESSSEYRPDEPVLLVGDAAKARRQLGWQPEVSFEELVNRMVDADMESLRNSI